MTQDTKTTTVTTTVTKTEPLRVVVSETPMAAPLTPDELTARIEHMVDIIRTHGCGDKAKNIAQGIADSRVDGGGRLQNVKNAFPQLLVGSVFNEKLDTDGNRKIDGDEASAITLAAGKWLADHAGKKPADVPLDQEFLNDYKEAMVIICGKSSGVCPAPRHPILPEKTKDTVPTKER